MNARQCHSARPVQTDCHYESIYESCTFFVTTIEFRPTPQAQRDDAETRARSPGRRSSTDSSNDSTTRPRDHAPDPITRMSSTTDDYTVRSD